MGGGGMTGARKETHGCLGKRSIGFPVTHTHTLVPGGVVDDGLRFVFGEVVRFELFDRGDSRPVPLRGRACGPREQVGERQENVRTLER